MIVGVSSLIFLLFAELIALIWYSYSEGGLFYTQKSIRLISEPTRGRDIPLVKFHPFFGFVNNDGQRNNYGFQSSSDYPLHKNHLKQYFIGIFGGSVAEQFAIYGKDQLIADLKQYHYFRDKEIVILNFGSGGYKQPQQLLILNYFLMLGQELDLVINLDGFNEVALSSNNNANGVEIAMPSIDHVGSIINMIDQTTLTSEKIKSLAAINRYKIWLNVLAQTMNKAGFASEYFVLKQVYKITYNSYINEILTFQLSPNNPDNSFIDVNTVTYSLPDSALYEGVAQNWMTASIMMSQILASKHILYFHFLQPNQYYSQKVFSPAEATIALNQNHPYRAAIEKGYPILINKAVILTQNGVNFYDAVDIFNNEPGIIYADSCCHYNTFGNNLLADFIASSIAKAENFQ